MVSRRRCPSRLAALAACLAATGCLGGTQNPSYFPFYLPAGDVIPTHAKPPGFGYYRNFDPKACKIEVTPASAVAPAKGQQVLIATVFDRDGQPRRKRRVEWIVDGPGSIIEVDESGLLPGRGYKVDNKYAVSYTDYFEHCITRGSDYPILPGQTWCVVSCPEGGQTTVTAYAPEVFDWENCRAFAKLTWTDADPGFPPGAARYGKADPPAAGPAAPAGPKLTLDLKLPPAAALDGETPATISLVNGGAGDSRAVTIRTTVPDGADLVRADPAPTQRTGRDLVWAVGGVPGGGRRDVALVLRPTRRGSLAMAATAETADGLRADRQAAAQVDAAGLRVSADAPPTAPAGGTVTVRVGVTNTGAVPVANARAWVTPGAGLRHDSGANPVEVPVGAIDPGKTRTVSVPLACDRSGAATVRVNVTADGGLTGRADAAVNVVRSELQATLTGPDVVNVGEDALFELKVTNAGDAAVTNAAAKAVLPAGLTAKGDTAWPLGPLNPNETKIIRLTASGDRPAGRGSVAVSAAADVPGGGPGLTTKAAAPVAVVGKPVLVMEFADPAGPVAVGGRAAYTVTVRNRGTGPAGKVEVTVALAGGLTPARGSGPGRSAATVSAGVLTFPPVDELVPGGVATFTVDADATTPGNARVTARVAAAGLAMPLEEEQITQIRPR